MSRLVRCGSAAIVISVLATGPIGVTSAHDEQQAGPYTLHVGWQNEPTYVGELNAVQLIVLGPDGAPITDLGPNDLHVTVTFGPQVSDALPLVPDVDEEGHSGTPGALLAPLIPTAPGDYTFHVTGSIHGQVVDSNVTSGESTFDTVQGASVIQFPAVLPSVAELVTRIERLEARMEALSSVEPSAVP